MTAVTIGLKRPTRRAAAALLTATVAAASFAAAATAAETPVVTTSTTATGTTFELQRDGCTARLLRRADVATLTYQNDCHQDLETRIGVFARLVAAALPAPADREAGVTVLVPGLEKAFPDFARRMAQAAARSTEWYGERAKREPRFGNPLVVKIANTPPVYRELQEALRPLDLKVRLAAVDKVLIALPAETPFADWLTDRGVNARKEVPYDADVAFRIAQ